MVSVGNIDSLFHHTHTHTHTQMHIHTHTHTHTHTHIHRCTFTYTHTHTHTHTHIHTQVELQALRYHLQSWFRNVKVFEVNHFLFAEGIQLQLSSLLGSYKDLGKQQRERDTHLERCLGTSLMMVNDIDNTEEMGGRKRGGGRREGAVGRGDDREKRSGKERGVGRRGMVRREGRGKTRNLVRG